MTAQEVATALGLHKESVLRLLRQRRFPNAIKTSNVWHIPEADVQAYAAQLAERGYGAMGRKNKAAALQHKVAKLKAQAARLQAELDGLRGS